MNGDKQTLLFKFLRMWVRLFSPKFKTEGIENLPDEPVILVGNHCQMNGPIAAELYYPRDRYTWCAGEMLELREVPAYAFEDFWSEKPKRSRWFYKIASYLIAPVSVCVFNNAHTIAVGRGGKVVKTFKDSVKALNQGADIIIFPEENRPYNNIIYDFQEGFIDLARLYHKRTGNEIQFVPLYIAPNLAKMYIGKPTRFSADEDIHKERSRIREYLMKEITDMARSLPLHTVVPYRNMGRRNYPKNKGE